MQLGKSLAAMPSSGIRDTFNLIAGKADVINLAPGEPNFPTRRTSSRRPAGQPGPAIQNISTMPACLSCASACAKN